MYDVIIIGAGAAGLMAAGTAAAAGHKTLVIEKMEKAGRKIRITGKGRCNITNARPAGEFLDHIRAGKDFFSYSFAQFDNRATISFFRDEGLKLEIERGERVFPASGKAWDVADTLKDFALEAGVEIIYDTQVQSIRTAGTRVCGVSIKTKRGFPRNIETHNIIIATGGITYPATGSTGDGYRFANELGHTIVGVRPSLVPLESDSSIARMLTGTKLRNINAVLLVDGQAAAEEFGEIEFTKRGIEGPVILRISRLAVDALIDGKNTQLKLDIKPALDEEILLGRFEREYQAAECNITVGELLRKLMPAPVVAPFAVYAELETDTRFDPAEADLSAKIITALKDIRFQLTDYRPFEEAIITAGGIDTTEVDPLTMQSRIVKGLYFAGEVLDIDADTGGYNLQVAFSTGRMAGQLKK